MKLTHLSYFPRVAPPAEQPAGVVPAEVVTCAAERIAKYFFEPVCVKVLVVNEEREFGDTLYSIFFICIAPSLKILNNII